VRIALKEVPVLSSHHADIPKNRWSWRLLYNFLLYVSPVALLTVAFPFVTPILSKNYVGSVPLIQIILAASIVVPWLSQAVCMPIYRALESEHLKVEDARREVQEEAAILKRDHKSKEAQELTWQKGEAYSILTNTTAQQSPYALDFKSINLINYDFDKYGATDLRKRLITKWVDEVKLAK